MRKKEYVCDYPMLMSQWNVEKNKSLGYDPYRTSMGSDKKVWWICSKNHEWKAKVNVRKYSDKCPICLGRKVLVGYNDLATVIPYIAKDWHPTLNGTLTPYDVTRSSNKKVWWICEKGHEWQTSVAHRSNGRRCPMCYGEYKTSFPEQAIFYYLEQITFAQNRYKVDTKTEIDIYLPEYKIGIEYDGAFFHKGEKAYEREKRKEEKLSSLGILLIRVKEGEESSKENVIYSKQRASDQELTHTIEKMCSYLSSYIPNILDVDIDVERDRYKIYERYIQSEKDNSLLTVNPSLVEEWDFFKNEGLNPEYISAHSNKYVWWKCKEGHQWKAMVNTRSKGHGCPYCSGLKTVVGVNDLSTVNPKLASEWHMTKNDKLSPEDVTASSNKFVWWQCEKGHEWRAMIYDRSNGCGCPICSGHQILVGYNDLSTVNPELASEWHPTKNGNLKPTAVTKGSNKRVWWQCEKGHEWNAVISSRSAGHSCPYCAGQRVITGVNDLNTTNPKLTAEWHPTKNEKKLASEIMTGSNKKAWWLGKCGHEWEATIASRNAGRGCPYCSSQKLMVGFNDLATLNPKLAAEWHPSLNGELRPFDFMPGSNKRVWWKCSKGHEWQNTVNVRNGGNGCPYCSNQMLLKGYNDLETVNPMLAKQWHPTLNGDLTSSDVMFGSNKKAWWLCEKGHEWQAQISSRNKGAGCMTCYNLRRRNKNKM